MSNISIIHANAGSFPPASGNPRDFEFASEPNNTAVLSFRQVLNGGVALGVLDSITALAGGGAPGATQLSANGQPINRVTTVASAGDSVLLPAASPGAICIVVNGGGGNSMNVFPGTGVAINAVASGSAFAMAQNARVLFFCVSATQWYTLPLVAS